MHTWTISQCALVRSPEIFFFVASCLFFCFLLYLKFSHTFRSFFAVFYLANRFSDFIYSSDFSFTVYLVFGRRKFNFISCSILLLKKTCVYRFSVEDSKKKYIYPMPHRCLHCSSNAKIQCVTDPDTFIAWEERQQIRRWLFQMLIIKIAKFMGGEESYSEFTINAHYSLNKMMWKKSTCRLISDKSFLSPSKKEIYVKITHCEPNQAKQNDTQ